MAVPPGLNVVVAFKLTGEFIPAVTLATCITGGAAPPPAQLTVAGTGAPGQGANWP